MPFTNDELKEVRKEAIRMGLSVILKRERGVEVINLREVLDQLMASHKTAQQQIRQAATPIVCLCGSTKFKADFLQAQADYETAGFIVLSIGTFPHADEIKLAEGQKKRLDALHLKKIDLAGTVCVIDVNGYIGESTAAEITYAKKHDTKVVFWSKTKGKGIVRTKTA